MNQEYNDTDVNKNICQAVGCFAKATDEIALEGGTFGVISVLVCRNCIGKFQDDCAPLTKSRSVAGKRGTAQ